MQSASYQPLEPKPSEWVRLAPRRLFARGVPAAFAGAPPGFVSGFLRASRVARIRAEFVRAKRYFPLERFGWVSPMQRARLSAAPVEDCWAKERAFRLGWRFQQRPQERRSGLVWWERVAASLPAGASSGIRIVAGISCSAADSASAWGLRVSRASAAPGRTPKTPERPAAASRKRRRVSPGRTAAKPYRGERRVYGRASFVQRFASTRGTPGSSAWPAS
mgnify:CR=1 FL=1